MVLGFDDQRPPLVGDLGAETRSGDPAADDDDIELAICSPGYEFESRAV